MTPEEMRAKLRAQSERIEEASRRVEAREWMPGPWCEEPGRVEWRSEGGVPCLIVRNHFGALCGYAAVEPGHPWHGRHYDAVRLQRYPHGGLTYAGACADDICHTPQPGESDDVWWLGFDCSHAGDLVPGIVMMSEACGLRSLGAITEGNVYRDLDFVKGEVEAMAAEVRRARNG